jgi:aspartyl-tRNA(Asn)/glutamyl-tRNA(Gln) amidotransferase subunit A
LSHGYYDDYYKKAVQTRGMIRSAFEKAFESVDLILSPVCGTTAFELGGRIRDPLAMYAGDTFTASVNLAGLPAASAPCGFSADGLPVGMQFAGRDFGEGAILDTLTHYQQATDFHTRRPKVGANCCRGTGASAPSYLALDEHSASARGALPVRPNLAKKTSEKGGER